MNPVHLNPEPSCYIKIHILIHAYIMTNFILAFILLYHMNFTLEVPC